METFQLELDPRTKILILLGSNLLIFFNPDSHVQICYIVFLSLLYLLSHRYKALLGFLAIGVLCLLLNHFILPAGPKIFISLFSISINYTLKIFPNMMSAAFLILTTSLHDAILAMRKFHFSQNLITALSVTFRYFPAIREEMRHIADAMKMRSLPLISRLVAFSIPMMMAATNTAEELSAAAVTRGIENPSQKTSLKELKFRSLDITIIVLQTAFLVWSVLS